MSLIKEYEVYYNFNIDFAERNGIPCAGKTIIKASNESDAEENFVNRTMMRLGARREDISVKDVIYWDEYYDD